MHHASKDWKCTDCEESLCPLHRANKKICDWCKYARNVDHELGLGNFD
jgi:hypothetical protein